MIKTTVEVKGMMCGMCEAHVNDAVRKAFPDVKKVTSSHSKNETVITSETQPDAAELKSVIEATGYEVGAITSEEAKKGIFGK
ncbi:MAG: cation transporter [Oscillospiraceae bacterium]|nr:cation transporter [Oscillospiraceae bacterium]